MTDETRSGKGRGTDAKRHSKKGKNHVTDAADEGGMAAAVESSPSDTIPATKTKRRRKPATKPASKVRNIAEARRKVKNSGAAKVGRPASVVPLMRSEEAVKLKGGRLLMMLFGRANKDGISYRTLAERIDVSTTYLYALRGGARIPAAMSEAALERIARYLQMPPLRAFLLAERHTHEHFYTSPEDAKSDLARAVRYLLEDESGPSKDAKNPTWKNLIPAALGEAEESVQYAVVRMYEELTGKRLLTEGMDLAAELAAANEFADKRAELREKGL